MATRVGRVTQGEGHVVEFQILTGVKWESELVIREENNRGRFGGSGEKDEEREGSKDDVRQ